MYKFLAAVQFLTVLPVPSRQRQVQSEDIARSLAYFPLVGALLGGGLALLDWALRLWLPAAIVPLLLVIALLGLTGALHFDGFLDCCDGLFGYHPPARRLEIMRDSRVGSFAVAGGWALLSLKYATLAQIPSDILPAALIVGPLLGRGALVAVVALFPYGRTAGLGADYKRYNTRLNWVLAGLSVVVIAGLTLRGPGLAMAGLSLVLAWLFGRWVMTRLPDGLTGDTYGALAELTEMLAWLGIAASANIIKPWL